MSDELPDAYSYTVTCWDCPDCGEVQEATDADLDSVETCESCGQEVHIR